MRRFAVALATLCLLAAQLIFAGIVTGADPSRFTATPLTPDSTFVGAKSTSGAIAKSDPSLLGRTDATRVNVMIKYDYDVAASYTGGVKGLAATSPRKTGKSLKANETAVKAYTAYASKLSDKITARAEKAVPGLTVRFSYDGAYGGVEASVPANQIGALLKTDGVVAVQQDKLEQPLDDNTSFIGATAVWPSLGGSANAGSNVIVGVIDTGVWPEHPMLAQGGLGAAPGGSRACQFGDGTDVAHLGPSFTCNNKLIGAYAKTATYMANTGAGANEFCNNTTHQCSARDSEGHGTHTTTTAAGDCVTSAILYGVERGPVCGIAPGAHVIQYRVCLASGCFGSDSVSAVQQAIADGVDVINFSISGGAQPYSDAVELAFLDAVHAGISVNASAGNSGPGAGTSDHGGPWVTTVGASTGPREFGSVLHLTADGGASLDIPGITLTAGISSPTPVVMAATLPGENALCQSTLAAATATGKIVACQRGVNGRIDKGRRVLAGGAAGMILYNPVKQDQESDNHYLPAIHIDGPSAPFTTFVTTHTNVRATWAQGVAQPGQADMMAAFSSRGPTGDWIKPDITAPGVQVLAGTTPQPDQTTADNGPVGNLYMAIAGTSMSSPHAAGVSALVKAAHPSWTPEQIKSALMTSSVQTVVKEDGVTPATPFDMGAGSIRADRAVHPTLVFDETYNDFVAAGSDPIHRIDLNIASIDATTMTGEITTKRTALNVSGKNQSLNVSVQSPAGTRIVVTTKAPGPNGPGAGATTLKVSKGKTLTFWVTISAPLAANGQYLGRINLTPQSGTPVTIPVAFVKKQGAVTLSHSCDPTSFSAKTGVSHCSASVSNFGSVPAKVDLTVSPQVNGSGLQYLNIAPPATSIGPANGVHWSGTLAEAVPPQVDSITVAPHAQTPDGGYLDLSLLGVGNVAGVGDDTISNFNVPGFFYGGESYTRIGVVSNGYIVVGGGDSGDIVFAPQHFPVPARPNNVLALLWTDLNPAGAGGIRVALLNDGAGTSWIVVDWAGVKNFGNATTHSFEAWIRVASGAPGTGPDSEQITYSYGPNLTFPGDGPGLGNAGTGDADSGVNWGAENRDGSSGVSIPTAPANGSEYFVNTSPPAAGGTQTVTFDLKGNKTGAFDSVAEMTSNLTPGTTQVIQTVHVTP
jgi:subtilisin family serine protease